MCGEKYCPICEHKRTHIGIARKYSDGFFLIPRVWIGFEIVRKCKNGHYWTRTWMRY